MQTNIEMSVSHVPSLKQKLWENVAASLGNDFSEKLDKRFDLVFAERNLVLYDMRDIPAPPRPVDSRITNVRFCSDLAAVRSSIGGDPSSVLARIF